jgi:hypothetical protein
MIISVPDMPRGGIQVLFEHQKQQNPPLDLACPNYLSVWSPASLLYPLLAF